MTAEPHPLAREWAEAAAMAHGPTREAALAEIGNAMRNALTPLPPPRDMGWDYPPAKELAAKLRRAVRECSGYEPSLSLLEMTADMAADWIDHQGVSQAAEE